MSDRCCQISTATFIPSSWFSILDSTVSLKHFKQPPLYTKCWSDIIVWVIITVSNVFVTIIIEGLTFFFSVSWILVSLQPSHKLTWTIKRKKKALRASRPEPFLHPCVFAFPSTVNQYMLCTQKYCAAPLLMSFTGLVSANLSTACCEKQLAQKKSLQTKRKSAARLRTAHISAEFTMTFGWCGGEVEGAGSFWRNAARHVSSDVLGVEAPPDDTVQALSKLPRPFVCKLAFHGRLGISKTYFRNSWFTFWKLFHESNLLACKSTVAQSVPAREKPHFILWLCSMGIII